MTTEVNNSAFPEIPYSERYGYSDGFPSDGPLVGRSVTTNSTVSEPNSSGTIPGGSLLSRSRVGGLAGALSSALNDSAKSAYGNEEFDPKSVAQRSITEGAKGAVGGAIEHHAEGWITKAAVSGEAKAAGIFSKGAFLKGRAAGIAGAIVAAGATAINETCDYMNGKTSGSRAAGKIASEGAICFSAAATGALIGSIVPGPGTVLGAVIGFGVGVVAGVAVDFSARSYGVDRTIAEAITDAVHSASNYVKQSARDVAAGARFIADTAVQVASDTVDAVKKSAVATGNAVVAAVTDTVDTVKSGIQAMKRGILGLFA